MLLASVLVYIAITLAIGIYSTRYVQNSRDFIVAGNRLPLYLEIGTVFATWFGAESVLGASSKMTEGGLLRVIEDPFGASLCLILVAIFFARPLYRLKLLTFGDFYREKYGRAAEAIAAVTLIISYFGWVAAQMIAMGIILHLLSGLEVHTAIVLSFLIVVAYTFLGGMWAVSLTDFIQSVFIVAGIVFAVIELLPQAGGWHSVIGSTPPEFFSFLPEHGFAGWMEYLAAWITIGLGSIPQQDVYQRVMASRSEKVAVQASYSAGLLYLFIGLLPLLLGLMARVLMPGYAETDPQLLLPHLIMQKTSLFVQILFFGALVSAIMSTASGATLAPAVILSENLLKPRFGKMTDKKLLLLSRLSVLFVAAISLSLALLRKDIYELVGEASAISMVSLFVPLVAGLFFKSGNQWAAVLSMLAGLFTWIVCNYFFETGIPPILAGTIASLAGFMAGAVLRPSIRR